MYTVYVGDMPVETFHKYVDAVKFLNMLEVVIGVEKYIRRTQ